ncbi:hypothetical protein BDZ97DRAFT_1065676 [Flammula alnicola]|nr:hypothetical protein BDZ97DRAFT_1065676 [Flammula alnicola]
MVLSTQLSVRWAVIITVFHVVAISSTVFRVFHRCRRRQMWFDDYLVIVPLVVDCAYLSTFWISFGYKYGLAQTSDDAMLAYFVATVAHFTILWFSRISLALSLARIFSTQHLARRISLSLAGVFFSMYCLIICLTTALCQGQGHPWYRINEADCFKGPQHIAIAGVISVTADFVADILLVVCPFLMLRKLRLPRNQRRLIVAAFSASVLTLIPVSIFCAFWYGRLDLGSHATLLKLVAGHVVVTTALLVCNLLVITMFFFRIFRGIYNIEESENSTSDNSRTTASVRPSARRRPSWPSHTDAMTRNCVEESENSSVKVTQMSFTDVEWPTQRSSRLGSDFLPSYEASNHTDIPIDPHAWQTSTFESYFRQHPEARQPPLPRPLPLPQALLDNEL